MVQQPIQSSNTQYAIAGGIFLAGIVLFIILLMTGTNTLLSKMPQVVVPGTHDIEIKETGNYTMFYESESLIDDKLYSSQPDFPSMQLQFFEIDNLITIPLRRPESFTEFSLNNRTGIAVADFKIVEPGKYRLIATPGKNSRTIQAVLSVGKEFSSRYFWMMFKAIAVGMIALAIAITIIILTLRKRKEELAKLNAKRSKMLKIARPASITAR